MLVSIGTFLCPADAAARVPGYGRCNYRFSIGPSAYPYALTTVPRPAGAFTNLTNRDPASFRDGLSQTVGVSERVQGDWTRVVFRPGDYLVVDQPLPLFDPDAALARCDAVPVESPHDSRGGESWFFSGLHYTTYNHATTPNPGRPECAFGGPGDGASGKAALCGVMPARSRHVGGVHAITMDGAVRFVPDGIDLRLWRSLSTPSGGEVVSHGW